MAISTTIPGNWKLPLFWAVVDGSMAGNLTESQPALLVGQMLAPGVAVPNVPIPIGSAAVAKQQFGAGSMLERMVNRFLAGNPTQQLWCIPVADPVAGQKAAGSVSFAVAGLQSGVLNLYIAGQKVAISVYSTDTAVTIAANLVAAINAMTTLPVVAAVDGTTASKVDLTCRWKGLTGNDIDLRLNYLGLYGGEATPVGLTPTIVDLTGGAGEPDFTAAISAIASTQFYHLGLPFDDTGSLQAWDAEYGFGPGGRWSYTRQQYGWIYNAHRADYADGLTWGLAHNSAVTTTMIIEPDSPSPVWEWVAGYCAQGAAALLDDPARPLQTLQMPGLLPAPIALRFSQSELNDFVNSGLAVQATAPSGTPMILREALQYQLNSFGQADTAFALLTVLSNLAELLSRMKSAITSKYARVKLAPDGTNFGPGQAIVTPTIVKGELVAEARQAEYDGLMSNVTAFKQNLLVQINDQDPNRLDILWPPQLMGQLRDFDVLAQFRLQYPTISLT
jgi:phage tail sheath gpL-like